MDKSRTYLGLAIFPGVGGAILTVLDLFNIDVFLSLRDALLARDRRTWGRVPAGDRDVKVGGTLILCRLARLKVHITGVKVKKFQNPEL